MRPPTLARRLRIRLPIGRRDGFGWRRYYEFTLELRTTRRRDFPVNSGYRDLATQRKLGEQFNRTEETK